MRDYSIEELESLTGFARRTIRYYIQKGLVDAPFGARKTPRYTQSHVEQLLQIRKFKSDGLNLSKIAELLGNNSSTEAEISSIPVGEITTIVKVSLAAGVALEIDVARCAMSQDDIRTLSEVVINHLQQTQGK